MLSTNTDTARQPTNTIAILRECKNKWERRCSLTPTEVEKLVNEGIRVLVQPSTTRCYTEDEFEDAGAIIQEDVSEADVFFGVKEVPIENLMENKTYFMFSHIIKAQSYNMPLLDRFLENKVRIIDFECIREAKKEEGKTSQRLVAFGRYAGVAGAFDFIRGCGEFLLEKKFQTPLVYLGSAYMYENYEAMQDALTRMAKNIEKGGLPKVQSPMVFAVTGTGRVAQGIMEVLKMLPHVIVEPDNLQEYVESMKDDKNRGKKIVISQFSAKDLVKLKDDSGAPFDKQDYYKNPHLYKSKFYEQLPYVSWLINGVYWEPRFPRVLTKKELEQAVSNKTNRLMGVCDISADYEGSIEFTERFTNIEQPFLLWDAVEEEFKEKFEEINDNCILFHSVDHLPAEMPKEASNHFGEQLYQFVSKVAKSDINLSWEAQKDTLPTEIYNAVLCCHGELTPNYAYISELRLINEKVEKQQADLKLELKEQSPGLRKGIKRNLSLITINLQGHLFDTKAFNQAIDVCEENKIQFRVVGWQIGNYNDQPSIVSIQMMAKNKASLNDCLEQIEEMAEKTGVQLTHAEDEDRFGTTLDTQGHGAHEYLEGGKN